MRIFRVGLLVGKNVKMDGYSRSDAPYAEEEKD